MSASKLSETFTFGFRIAPEEVRRPHGAREGGGVAQRENVGREPRAVLAAAGANAQIRTLSHFYQNK